MRTAKYLLIPALILMVPEHLGAQPKVGIASEDPVMGSQNSYYSTNFINGRAWGRGNSGVVTQHGAAALFVNPANLPSESKFDVFLEGAAFRNSLSYGSLFFGNDTYTYRQPNLRFNALAGALQLNERMAVGIALSQRRQYLLEIEDTIVETTYEYVNDRDTVYLKSKADLQVYDLSFAVAATPLSGLDVGIAVSLLRHNAYYSNLFAGSRSSPLISRLDDSYNAWLFLFGTSYQIGPIRGAAVFRTSEKFAGVHRYSDDIAISYSVHIPTQFAAAISYSDFVNFEFRYISRSDDYLRAVVSEYGGGIRLPLRWIAQSASGYFNTGLFRRDSQWAFGYSGSQYFVSFGVELPVRDFALFATLVDGHLLTKGEGEISELLCGIGYSLSR